LKNIRIITISEGAAGMKSQIHGLANFINPNFQNFDIEIKALFKNFPIQLIPSNELVYKNLDEIKINDKTIIISCGKKSVKASIILKKKFFPFVFNIHIQNPKTHFNMFDMIVYPKHDKINKPNAIPTLLALHNIKFKEGIRDQNKINFIIGGSSKYFKFGDATIQKIYEEILFLSNNYLVKIIPSRRTPINFIKNLKKMNLKNVSIFEDQFNPTEYGNLLSEASTQIATWDSISMISEAISSGTKTLIFPFEEKKCPKRYKDFYNNILEENFISFYNRDLKAPTPDLTGYNNELKSKILNKIESNLWFKTDATQGFNTK